MLPTRDNIIESIKNIDNVLDKELSGFNYQLSGFGEPLYYPGGFGIVFPMSNNNSKKYAFKVWYTEIADIQSRMQKVSDYLKLCNLPYFVDYSFTPGGMRIPSSVTNGGEEECEDNILDTVKMEWVEGKMLKVYIDSLLKNPAAISQNTRDELLGLANKFKECFKTLHSKQISHGDLQHGNIVIVTSSGDSEIKLIDYDSIYVPTLPPNTEQNTAGIAGYQHPDRINGNTCVSTEKDDYFSEKIIYTSLLILSKFPELWLDPKAKVKKNDYGLLFTGRDYTDFTNSYIFDFVKKQNDSELNQLLDEIAKDLSGNISNIEPLSGTQFVDTEKFKKKSKVKKTLTPEEMEVLGEKNEKPTYKVEEEFVTPSYDTSKFKKKK